MLQVKSITAASASIKLGSQYFWLTHFRGFTSTYRGKGGVTFLFPGKRHIVFPVLVLQGLLLQVCQEPFPVEGARGLLGSLVLLPEARGQQRVLQGKGSTDSSERLQEHLLSFIFLFLLSLSARFSPDTSSFVGNLWSPANFLFLGQGRTQGNLDMENITKMQHAVLSAGLKQFFKYNSSQHSICQLLCISLLESALFKWAVLNKTHLFAVYIQQETISSVTYIHVILRQLTTIILTQSVSGFDLIQGGMFLC